MPEANESLAFLNALSGLATRLAIDGVVVYSMSYQSLNFGSWELETGRRRMRVRARWEGKDRQLRVWTATVTGGSAAREWQLVEEHDLRKRRLDAAQLFATVQAAIRAHAGA
jgi:hypothetical protein